MRHSMVCGCLLVFLAGAIQPVMLNGQTPIATDPYVPLSQGEKGRLFVNRMISPSGLAKSAFTAGINQWQDSPHEWGQGLAGYSRRYSHKIANRAVENGIGFGLAAALHEDPRYFRSGETGFGRRALHALASTIVTRHDNGDRTIAVWRVTGNYGAQFVSNAWRPDRYSQVSDTLARGTVSVGYDAASNFLKEFWPDIRKRIFRR